ncbi:MAG: hypothetical protein IKN49_04770 [Elusimicrobiaceae bacterium]|nr:hypothetical protein [Elusimicrobiaceae bacterium]
MNGWARFFLLLVCCLVTLILWPQYNRASLAFLGMYFVLWTCITILLSVLINMFAIYKVEWLHRIISIVFVVVMAGCLLYYFPLINHQTPWARLKANQWPSGQDIQEGIKQLTFNFDFVRRNVHRDANYINQKLDDGKETTTETTQEIKKIVKKQQETLDIVVEQFKPEEEE